jgi:hypothetical protein
MVVAATVEGFFVREGDARREVDRRVQMFCATYLAFYAFLPVVIVVGVAAVRREAVDRFGEGGFRVKSVLLGLVATLLTLGAGFRAVVGYDVRPLADPGWYHGKACYYCFNFVLELVVVCTYIVARFDRRFHIPDGSWGPGAYSGCVYGVGTSTKPGKSGIVLKKKKRKWKKRGDAAKAEAANGGAGSGPEVPEMEGMWPWPPWPPAATPTYAPAWAPMWATMSATPSVTTPVRANSTKSLPTMSTATGSFTGPSSANGGDVSARSVSSLVGDDDLAWMGRAMVRSLWVLVSLLVWAW